jgi:hypothetical protein
MRCIIFRLLFKKPVCCKSRRSSNIVLCFYDTDRTFEARTTAKHRGYFVSDLKTAAVCPRKKKWMVIAAFFK